MAPRRKIPIFLLPILVILLAGAGVYGYIWKIQSDVRPYLNVFLDNVSVDGIDLSGLTWAEGSQLVWDHVNQKQNGWYVRLRNANGQYKDITAQTLGISFDPTAALNAAWAIGHDVDGEERKDIFQLKEEIEAAQNTQNAFFSAQQSANTAPIDEILQTLETAAYRAPSDAYIISFNPDDSANPFTFQQEVYGQRLDTTAVRERILQMVQNLESGEVLLEPETIAPNVTVADLQKTVELRYRATTPISSASTEDRTENIRIAFAKETSAAHSQDFLDDGKTENARRAIGLSAKILAAACLELLEDPAQLTRIREEFDANKKAAAAAAQV